MRDDYRIPDDQRERLCAEGAGLISDAPIKEADIADDLRSIQEQLDAGEGPDIITDEGLADERIANLLHLLAGVAKQNGGEYRVTGETLASLAVNDQFAIVPSVADRSYILLIIPASVPPVPPDGDTEDLPKHSRRFDDNPCNTCPYEDASCINPDKIPKCQRHEQAEPGDS